MLFIYRKCLRIRRFSPVSRCMPKPREVGQIDPFSAGGLLASAAWKGRRKEDDDDDESIYSL